MDEQERIDAAAEDAWTPVRYRCDTRVRSVIAGPGLGDDFVYVPTYSGVRALAEVTQLRMITVRDPVLRSLAAAAPVWSPTGDPGDECRVAGFSQ